MNTVIIPQKIDIIWNMSLLCPWDCKICCVDAVQIKDKTTDAESPSFAKAAKRRQKIGKELTLEEKLDIVNHTLDLPNIKINYSGGDPLVLPENIKAIQAGAQQFGKENQVISTTGNGLARYFPEQLADMISQIKFSFDMPKGMEIPYRPREYNRSNLEQATRYQSAGIPTSAEITLSTVNFTEAIITRLYQELHEAGIPEAYLMMLFPVGRMHNNPLYFKYCLSNENYAEAIKLFKKLEKKYKTPKINVQYALEKTIAQEKDNHKDKNVYRGSFGITPAGLLITNAWGVGKHGQPLHEEFILGNLHNQTLDEIFHTQKAIDYFQSQKRLLGQGQVF